MKKHIKKVKGKIKVGSMISVLIVSLVVTLMSIQVSAHGPPELNDLQLNNGPENNISGEESKNFYEGMYDLMSKYNFWPSIMMGYRGMGCH